MLKLFRRLTYFLRSRRADRELAQEVEFHRALRAEGLERAGLDAAAARRESLRAMGNVALAREDAKAVWIAPWLESVWRDVAYACRLMTHRPTFAAAMIVVMGLGIGATTAVFSLLDNLVLKSLPVRSPERLVFLEKPSFSYPIFQEVQARSASLFSGIFAWNVDRLSIQWVDALEPSDVLMASGQFYSTLGVSAELGRVFDASDDRIGGGPSGLVATISHACWERRFASDPAVVGRQVRVARRTFTIIGVTPAGFFGVAAGLDPELTIPLTSLSDDAALRAASSSWLHIMARLADSVTLADANAAFAGIWPGVLEATTNPGAPADRRAMYLGRKTALASARTGFSRVRNQFEEPLWMLLALVGLLLAVACASAANLLLARGVARRREMAVRLAIGANRARLVRQMLIEAFVWTMAGGAAGLLGAWWGSALLVRMMATSAEAIVLDVNPDWRVLLFVMILALLTASVCAVGPALRATRLDVASALKVQGAVSAGLLRRWSSGKGLVAVQIALTVLLLAGAALFSRSLQRILAQDTGFQREGLVIASVDALAAGYTGPRLLSFYDTLLERLRRIPSVESASLSWYPPISDDMGSWTQSVEVDGVAVEAATVRQVYFNAVSPGYIRTLGMRLLDGRDFSERDTSTSTRVVIINESLARKAFAGANPIGRRVSIGRNASRKNLEVIGIVQDAKYQRLQETPRGIAYLPCAQLVEYLEGTNLVAEIRGASGTGVRAVVAGEVRGMDRAVPLQLETVAERISGSLVKERVMALLAALLGLSALALACAAVYGLMSYAVSRQTNEIGLRLALGSPRADVLRMVLRDALKVTAIGIAIAVPAAGWLGRFARTQLFEIGPLDPVSLVGACVVMGVLSATAAFLPALKAARIDPVRALKTE
jgi:putative ABC transport system permease protein